MAVGEVVTGPQKISLSSASRSTFLFCVFEICCWFVFELVVLIAKDTNHCVYLIAF